MNNFLNKTQLQLHMLLHITMPKETHFNELLHFQKTHFCELFMACRLTCTATKLKKNEHSKKCMLFFHVIFSKDFFDCIFLCMFKTSTTQKIPFTKCFCNEDKDLAENVTFAPASKVKQRTPFVASVVISSTTTLSLQLQQLPLQPLVR